MLISNWEHAQSIFYLTPSNTLHDSSMARNYDVVSPSLLESITGVEDWVDRALIELESHLASSLGEPHPNHSAASESSSNENEPRPKKKFDNSRYKLFNPEEMDTLSKAFVPKNTLHMTKWSVSNFELAL